jgi:transposase
MPCAKTRLLQCGMGMSLDLPDDIESLKRLVIELRSQLARLGGAPSTSASDPLAPTAEQLELTLEKQSTARTTAHGPASPALLARVLVAKYTEHVPLHRQSRLYALAGARLNRSTLSAWVAGAHAVLAPLIDALDREVLASAYLHAGQMPYPVRASRTGKARTGRMWAYVRDERAWGSTRPVMVMFRFTPDRKWRHARTHLAGFQGVLHTASSNAFAPLLGKGRIREAASWAQVRKAFLDLYEAEPSPLAAEVLARIDALRAIEVEARRSSPEVRRAARQRRAAPLLGELREWLSASARERPSRSALGATLRDTIARWDALAAYLEDGRIDADNDTPERALKAIALTRKSRLFVGADANGERAAGLYSLMVSATLNDLDPESYLRDVLTRIGEQPLNRMQELLPGMT